MPQNASVAIERARTLMNNASASVWTDSVLMRFVDIAFPELQTILKKARCPIMRTISAAQTVNAGVTSVGAAITDMAEAIRLWETTVGGSRLSASRMTEFGVLPSVTQTTTLRYWVWNGAAIELVGATVNRDVFVQYWRQYATPASSAGSLIIPEAELYIAPRIAALAMASVGQDDLALVLNDEATSRIGDIIAANKGQKTETRP